MKGYEELKYLIDLLLLEYPLMGDVYIFYFIKYKLS